MLTDKEIESIRTKIKSDGFTVLKNDELTKIGEEARKEYFASFTEVPLRSSGFRYEELQKAAIRKKNISSSNGVGESYAQVLQTTYYPKKADKPWTQKMFDYQIVARNRIIGLPDWYGNNPPTEKYWNACRIHHYPRGGGFMVEHTDTHFPKIVGELHYLQTLFLMSKKGVDFNKGGGIIRNSAGVVIDLEDYGIGTLVFFDGRVRHGVRDVDPEADFSLTEASGRLAAIAGQYEYRGAQ